MRLVVAALVTAAVVAGAVGYALATEGAEDDRPVRPVHPEEAAEGATNENPGSAEEYWTEERMRNAKGG